MADRDQTKDSQIGVRVDPAFRAEVKRVALRYFGGNESLALREAGRLYVALRAKLGPQFEPTMALLLGEIPAPVSIESGADAGLIEVA